MFTARLEEIVLTTIWMESLPSLFTGVTRRGPLGGIGSWASYEAILNAAISGAGVQTIGGDDGTPRPSAIGDAGVGVPTVPWPRATGQGYWERYFEGRTVDKVTPQYAWKNLVPVRLRLPRLVPPQPAAGRASAWAEALAYPHGLLVAVGLRMQGADGEWEAGDAIDRLLGAREAKIVVAGAVANARVLRELGPALLDATREQAFGPEVEGGSRGGPFTVCTVIRGSGVNPQDAIPEGGDVHRLLDALAGLDRNWRTNRLPTLASHVLAGRLASPPGHVVYARKRGRAVWFPSHFTGNSGTKHALGCYHRNLTLASATVESLGALISATAGEISSGRQLGALPFWQVELTKRAAIILSQLYLGQNRNTYSTRSATAQIVDGDWLTDLEAMRGAFGLLPAAFR